MNNEATVDHSQDERHPPGPVTAPSVSRVLAAGGFTRSEITPAVKRGRTVVTEAVLNVAGFSCRRYWARPAPEPTVVVSYDEYVGTDYLTRVASALLALGGRRYIEAHAEEILAALDQAVRAERCERAGEPVSELDEQTRKSGFTIRRLVREVTMLGGYARYLQDRGYAVEFKNDDLLISGLCREGLLVRAPAPTASPTT